MKLSAEEAQRAYRYSQEKGPHPVELTTSLELSVEQIERVMGKIANAPDPRPDRVAEARHALHHHFPTSLEVAERMVWRMFADSVR